MALPTVILNGKPWHLRYDMNAIAEVEGALRMTIREIGLRLMRGKIGAREIRALVWAGILHEFEDAGIRQVGDWLTEAGVPVNKQATDDLMEKVLESLSSAFPEDRPTDGNDSKN